MKKSILAALVAVAAFSSVSGHAAGYFDQGWQPTSDLQRLAQPSLQFEENKKQPPPPRLKRQIPSSINPGTILPGVIIPGIDGNAGCSPDTPGCRPPETPGGGKTPPKCGDVGGNEPCW